MTTSNQAGQEDRAESMDNIKDSKKQEVVTENEPKQSNANAVRETVNKEEEKDLKKYEEIIEDKGPGIGGIAGLLGQTASILGALVQKEDEAPKICLPAEDVETYKAAFNDFDHNKDGHISTQDLHLSFRRA